MSLKLTRSDLGALEGLTARLGQRNREGIGQELNVRSCDGIS